MVLFRTSSQKAPLLRCGSTCFGRFVAEWRDDVHRDFRFFNSREEARQFIGTIDAASSIRKSNLEDVFIELTGRKEGL